MFFANAEDNANTNLIILENGKIITEQQLIEFLNAYSGEIIKISSDITYPSANTGNSSINPQAAIAIPAWAIGKWDNGSRRVAVPNHVSNSEIPIGTLRNIWNKLVGYKIKWE